MTTRAMPRNAAPALSGSIENVLTGPFDPATRDLLDTASGGDPQLLRALVQTGLSLGDLAREDGRWRWGGASSRTGRLADLIGGRVDGLADAQLAALRTLSESWARPYAVVARVTEDRPGPDDPAADTRLTRRERQVLTLLADGLTAGAIARRLCLSPRTVAKYQQRTYRKLGTSDRLTTVLRAQRLGLLPSLAARSPSHRLCE
jgi:DNA-binding CsgD family transcriptional regulator